MQKLSPKQEEVMAWVNGGWSLTCTRGCVVEVNGQRVCNLDTVTRLIKLGLVEKVDRFTYRKAKA